MTNAQADLIALTTVLNLMRGSEDFNSVHNDFLAAQEMTDSMSLKEETEAFEEVLRRRNLIKTA
jgi:hypothetical protein